LFSTEIDLSKYEQQIYSQNGEDGVLRKIFEYLDVDAGFCVEFGACDGFLYSNTLQFRKNGWLSFLIDGSYENPDINLYKYWITKDNILEIFRMHKVPIEFDLLSIDIDSNDWYVWREIGKIYHPKVVVIEYNPSCGPNSDLVIEYNPQFRWDGHSIYYGGSYLANYNLGRYLGYSLVYSTHLNQIFIRDDVLAQINYTFKDTNCIAKLFKGPADEDERLKFFSHRSSLELLQQKKLTKGH